MKNIFYEKSLNFIKYQQFSIILYSLIAYVILFTITASYPLLFLYDESLRSAAPFFLVLIRELFYSIVLLLLMIHIERKILIVLIFMLSLLCLNLIFLSTPINMLICGLRFLVPFLILVSPSNHKLSIDLMKRKDTFIVIIWCLLTLHLGLQVFHLFVGRGYYSHIFGILNARNPGLYFYPAASAFLTGALALLYFKLQTHFSLKKVLPFLLSLTLCSSITGFAASVFLVAVIIKKVPGKVKLFLIFYLSFSAYLLHNSRHAMTGDAYLRQTGGTRLELFVKAFQDSTLQPHKFGQYTNAAFKKSVYAVPDSMYTALIGNLGYFWFFITSIYLFFSIHRQIKLKKYQHKEFTVLLLFSIFSFGLISSEVGLATLLFIMSSRLESHSFIKYQ